MEQVILVDTKDNPIGTMEKMEAHKRALLHRAFSVVLFNDQGEILLQQRAAEKYHSGGLWTNTCCSHPNPDETTQAAAERRLVEEMGIQCKISSLFSFIYRAELDHDLTEYEFDHVFTGVFNGRPGINPDEVQDYRWVSPVDLQDEIEASPLEFTEWFKILLPQLLEKVSQHPVTA